MIKGNKRLPHESQRGYKNRLRREQRYTKGYLRGRRIVKKGWLATLLEYFRN